MAAHRQRFHPARSFAFVAVLVLGAGRAQADPMYAITDLGPRYGAALNNLGDVVGNSAGSAVLPAGGTPYIYRSYGPDAGRFVDLSGQVGSSAILTGISDSGQISGTMTTSGAYRGFVDSAGRVAPIPSPAGTSYSYAAAINNSGSVIGTDYGPSSGLVPAPVGGFVVNQGQFHSLGSLVPMAISGTGIVVGIDTMRNAGTIYQDGKITYIPGRQTEAMGVNDAGQVVGQYSPATNSIAVVERAFLYQNGQFQDLGTLGGSRSWAMGINALGQIVGTADVVPDSYALGHAFLYQNGTMTDLNALIAATSSWTLQSATTINDKGQILGYGIGPDGRQDTFLLTPTSEPPPIAPQVPEPSTAAFFALAGVGAAFRRAWRRRRS